MRLHRDMSPACYPALLSQGMNPLSCWGYKKSCPLPEPLGKSSSRCTAENTQSGFSQVLAYDTGADQQSPDSGRENHPLFTLLCFKDEGRKQMYQEVDRKTKQLPCQSTATASLKPNLWLPYFPMWSESAKVSLQVQSSVHGESGNS